MSNKEHRTKVIEHRTPAPPAPPPHVTSSPIEAALGSLKMILLKTQPATMNIVG